MSGELISPAFIRFLSEQTARYGLSASAESVFEEAQRQLQTLQDVKSVRSDAAKSYIIGIADNLPADLLACTLWALLSFSENPSVAANEFLLQLTPIAHHSRYFHDAYALVKRLSATIAPAPDELQSENGVPDIDTMPLRSEILSYVSSVRSHLASSWKNNYMKMWDDILNLPAVSAQIYKPGKQQGTNFNRNLVGNILHYLSSKGPFPNYNAAQMAFSLEGDKDHPVRAALGKDPDRNVVADLDRYFE